MYVRKKEKRKKGKIPSQVKRCWVQNNLVHVDIKHINKYFPKFWY